jgi:nucleotide-binding universal stress UspA family protein
MNILFALHESSVVEGGLREIQNRADVSNTTVRLITALDKFVPPAATLWYDGAGSTDDARDQVKARAEFWLDEIAQRFRSAGIRTEAFVRDGHPKTVILEEARAWPADLIMIGSHSHSILSTLVLGDITQEVLRDAPCPVEVIPQDNSAGDK